MGATDFGTGATLGATGEGEVTDAGGLAAACAGGVRREVAAGVALAAGAAGLAATAGLAKVAGLVALTGAVVGFAAALPPVVPPSARGAAGFAAGGLGAKVASRVAAGANLAGLGGVGRDAAGLAVGFGAALALAAGCFVSVLAGAAVAVLASGLARLGLATCLALAAGLAGSALAGPLVLAGDFITALLSCCRGDAGAGRTTTLPHPASGASIRWRAGPVATPALRLKGTHRQLYYQSEMIAGFWS